MGQSLSQSHDAGADIGPAVLVGLLALRRDVLDMHRGEWPA